MTTKIYNFQKYWNHHCYVSSISQISLLISLEVIEKEEAGKNKISSSVL